MLSAASLAATSVIGRFERLEPARVEIDLKLAHLTAVHFDGGDSVDLAEQRFQVVFDLPPRHVGGQRRSDGIDGDRQRCHVEPVNRRILDLLRKPLADRRDLLAHLGGGRLRIDFEPQLDADARHPLR